MSTGRYLEGVILGLVCAGSLAVAAHRVRLRLAPAWGGVMAWIADGAISVALLTLVLEIVGVVGALDRTGITAGCLLVGALVWALSDRRWLPAPAGAGSEVGVRPHPLEGPRSVERTASGHRALVHQSR